MTYNNKEPLCYQSFSYNTIFIVLVLFQAGGEGEKQMLNNSLQKANINLTGAYCILTSSVMNLMEINAYSYKFIHGNVHNQDIIRDLGIEIFFFVHTVFCQLIFMFFRPPCIQKVKNNE